MYISVHFNFNFISTSNDIVERILDLVFAKECEVNVKIVVSIMFSAGNIQNDTCFRSSTDFTSFDLIFL